MFYGLLIIFLAIGCDSTNEVTNYDLYGSVAVNAGVTHYINYVGEIPTKQEFIDYNNRDLRDLYLSEGWTEEHVDKFISDSLSYHLSYGDGCFASHYLLTHPTMQFINQDTCLLVVDSTLRMPDGSIAQMTIPMVWVMIKDSAYYYRGVKLSYIRQLYEMYELYEVDIDKYCPPREPFIVDYDSPVDMIDSLCIFLDYPYYFINRGKDKGERIYIYPAKCIFNAYIGLKMPCYETDFDFDLDFDLSDSVVADAKKRFVQTIQQTKTRIHRSNGTIYMNGEPVKADCRIDVDTTPILLDLTHDNTYSDICELVRFIEKATASPFIGELKKKNVRKLFYFKSDDKIYRSLLEKQKKSSDS